MISSIFFLYLIKKQKAGAGVREKTDPVHFNGRFFIFKKFNRSRTVQDSLRKRFY
jgi:hypothetical protein